MSRGNAFDEEMIQFFFGTLSEAQRTEVERRFLGDQLYFERMLLVESSLIRRYIDGHLSDDETNCFEQHFLKSASLRKLVEDAKKYDGLLDDLVTNQVP